MYKKFCCKEKIKPMYENIKEFDFFKPIKNFSKEYNIKFKFIESNKKKLDQSNENDLVMNYYIKSSSNISIIFFYPKALKHPNITKKVIKLLEQNGSIYYEKNIEMTYFMIYNLIFQLYYKEKRLKNPHNIINKIKRLGIDFNDKKIIKILVYKHKNKEEPINGNSSTFKMKLRNMYLDEDKKLKLDNLKLYDYLHVNNDDNEAYDYSGLLFNKNSLKILSRQQCWKIYQMESSINKFNLLKKFIYNYSQKQIESLIIIGSGVLFSLGLREMNDVDCTIIENKKIIDLKQVNKYNNEGLLDIFIEGSEFYNKEYKKVLDNRAKLVGAKDFKELIFNPKYYYYFMGLKFLRLKSEILIRLSRKRPAQITDLLVLRNLYNLNFPLIIPKESVCYNKIKKQDIITKVNPNKYYNTIKFYLKKRYFINLSIEQIQEWIKNKPNIKGGNKYYINIKNISD